MDGGEVGSVIGCKGPRGVTSGNMCVCVCGGETEETGEMVMSGNVTVTVFYSPKRSETAAGWRA
jgi:hypothetical protein